MRRATHFSKPQAQGPTPLPFTRPSPVLLSLGERAKEPRGPADVGTQLGGAPAGWSHSQGALELLGSQWEFGKTCPPASSPAACRSLSTSALALRGRGHRASSSSPFCLALRGAVCPCVAPPRTEAALWGWFSEDPLSQYLLTDQPESCPDHETLAGASESTDGGYSPHTPPPFPESTIDFKVLRAGKALSNHVIQSLYCTDEEMEAQRGKATCSRPHSWRMAEPGL